jgi:hypothetical protein
LCHRRNLPGWRASCFLTGWLPQPQLLESEAVVRRSLYRVLEDTRRIVAGLRRVPAPLPIEFELALSRVETAVTRALASSPDGETVAHAEEMVALEAVCDLHETARRAPSRLREELRPLINDWIEHAASHGYELQQH